MVGRIDMKGAWTGDDSITRAEMEGGVEAADILDLNHLNTDAAFKLVQVGSALTAATDGRLLWRNTGSPTDTPPRQLLGYDSSRGSLIGVGGTFLDSEPSGAINGDRWFDARTAAERWLWRSYIGASQDKETSLAGFRPQHPGFAFVRNNSGVAMDRYEVAVWAGTGRDIQRASLAKDPKVAGILCEDIASGDTGIIALAGSQEFAFVIVDETDHTVVAGDLLVVTAADGKARSVDTAPRLHDDGTDMRTGVPMGAFAEALTIAAGSPLICMARLLPTVGTGCRVYQEPSIIWQDLTPVSAEKVVIDASVLTSDDDGGQGAATSLQSVKHAPILAADLSLYTNFEQSGGATAFIQSFFRKDGQKNNRVVQVANAESSGSDDQTIADRRVVGLLGTSIGDPTPANNNVLGNKFFLRQDLQGSGFDWNDNTLNLDGYVY